jgi:hypothetical protein
LSLGHPPPSRITVHHLPHFQPVQGLMKLDHRIAKSLLSPHLRSCTQSQDLGMAVRLCRPRFSEDGSLLDSDGGRICAISRLPGSRHRTSRTASSLDLDRLRGSPSNALGNTSQNMKNGLRISFYHLFHFLLRHLKFSHILVSWSLPLIFLGNSNDLFPPHQFRICRQAILIDLVCENSLHVDVGLY